MLHAPDQGDRQWSRSGGCEALQEPAVWIYQAFLNGGKAGRVYGGVRLVRGCGFHSSPICIICGLVAALKRPLRETSIAEIFYCRCHLCAETLVLVFPCGLSVWCHWSSVVGIPRETCCGGFLPTSKTSSTKGVGWEVLVQFSHGFCCSVSGFCHFRCLLWCLWRGDWVLTIKFTALSRGDSALPMFPGVLWVLSICCLQWAQLLPSTTCLPVGLSLWVEQIGKKITLLS